MAEAGSSASATVAPQGELGDNKYLQAELQGGKIHLPVIVFEDPKISHLIHEVAQIITSIVFPDPEENHKPGTDLTDYLILHCNSGRLHSLNYGSHQYPTLCQYGRSLNRH